MGKANEIWKEIKPKIGEMLAVVNDVETRAEKAQEEAYQKGLSDAWDAARTLWNTPNRKEIFGHTTFNTVLTTLTAQETIEKIRQYEQEKEMDGLRQNIQTIVDQCGYTLDEIAEVLKEMREE